MPYAGSPGLVAFDAAEALERALDPDADVEAVVDAVESVTAGT